jgi:hypothetical protein
MAGGEGAGGGVGGEDDGAVSDGGARQVSDREASGGYLGAGSCSGWAAPMSVTALTGLSEGVHKRSD